VEFKTAIKYSQKALKLTTELGDKEEIGLSLYIIGKMYRSSENYEKAIDIFQQVIKLWKELDNEKGYGRYLLEIAELCYAQI